MPRKSLEQILSIAAPDASLKRELAETKQRLTAALKLVEQQAEALERQRAAKFSLPTGKANKTRKGDFVRVVIPDSHGCFIDQPAAAAFLRDLESLRPAEIVMLGDHLDCGGFLAEHHTWGYVAEAEYTFEQDVAAGNVFLDAIQKRAPTAKIHYLQGNHERRLETWCVTKAMRSRMDAAYLLRMHSCGAVLSLARRGIEEYQQGKRYHGLSIPATIKLGKCHFTHGSSTAKHSAAVHLARFGANVVYGHTHRADSCVGRTVDGGPAGAWNPGCLSVLQPMWQHTNPTDWSHGYGVQLVRASGEFLHINVPVIDGASYLMQLTNQMVG